MSSDADSTVVVWAAGAGAELATAARKEMTVM